MGVEEYECSNNWLLAAQAVQAVLCDKALCHDAKEYVLSLVF